MTAAWIYLSVAVLVEETWGLSLKAAAVMELGKWFCGVTVGLSLLSMWLLILVMRDGDVIESGTHETLMRKGGFYADLYNSQFEQAS